MQEGSRSVCYSPDPSSRRRCWRQPESRSQMERKWRTRRRTYGCCSRRNDSPGQDCSRILQLKVWDTIWKILTLRNSDFLRIFPLSNMYWELTTLQSFIIVCGKFKDARMLDILNVKIHETSALVVTFEGWKQPLYIRIL